MQEKSYLGTDSEPPSVPQNDEKTIAVLAHILTMVAPILAPLIIYLVKKNDSAFVAWHARESLNFQLTVFIICIILFISVIGILFIWVIGILSFILIVLATIKASEGKLY